MATVEDAQMMDAAECDLQFVTSLMEAERFRMKWLGVNAILRGFVLNNPGYLPRYERLVRRWEVRVFNLRTPSRKTRP